MTEDLIEILRFRHALRFSHFLLRLIIKIFYLDLGGIH